MNRIARYLTHPQVVIDQTIPIPEWGLSRVGRDRTEHLACACPWPNTTHIVTSTERKALETAASLAAAWACPVDVRPNMHENDRSATGFLPPTAFEAAADCFFARPNESFHGWETAKDAQARILREVIEFLWHHSGRDVLFVGHGAVGTLLYCALTKRPIDRRYDQANGGGYWFSFDIDSRQVLHHWRSMEAAAVTRNDTRSTQTQRRHS
ncbi:histidine phosphatase family protein [Roseobacter sp. OBYS 0001]|uniref:histidine phosphatase family protein n=1 Tax=Roseobacter sp. OBYS 0001 TaxID=882651 RepID=UPI001BBE1B68|nr:histidine phosphatase family protein [Roseobacter sp. OBYS 0001]GIT85636.1 phosphoglycerate mutase [Roseobacter sp. OBYS 0001]